MRSKKALFNTFTSLSYEAVAAISGLILSRMILSYFGSDYNGITVSITQFIGYIFLFSAGVGGVTQAALYKPLAEKDMKKISGIMRSTELFIRKIAIFFSFGLVILAGLFPFLVKEEFDWLFVFTLVLILGIGIIIQFFFEVTYLTLLIADQRGYIPTLVRTVVVILNTVIAAVLILAGCEIRVVKLVSAIVFMFNPIFIYLYVKKRYKLDKTVPPDNSAIKQRWDAFVDQLSWFIYNNFDIVLLTVFSTMNTVSVYTVYYMIIRMVRLLITSFSGTTISAPMGDMLARGEHEGVKTSLRLYEFIINSMSTILFVCTALLVVPFVSVYTAGITDADYIRPLLAYLICASEFATVFSFPYCAPVLAAGHFRQIRKDAIAQICISIVFSVIFFQLFGIVGIVLGKLCAMVYRSARYVFYMSHHVVRRSLWIAGRNLFLSLLCAFVIVVISLFLPKMGEISYLSWFLHSMMILGVSVGVTAVLTGLFYRKEFGMLILEVKYVSRK